jgi:hypothetical protein
MLLATTILLLVLRLPSAIISVMWLISAKLFINDKPPFPLRKFHSIANLCATLNAATTFIMFMIYGTKFRSEFTKVYCCCFDRIKTAKERIENKQEQRQIKQSIPNDDDINEQHIDNEIDPLSIIPSKENIRHANARHSSSATTSTRTTSIASLPSLRRLRNQRRNPRSSIERECDLINPKINLQQHYELTIPEDECNIQNNDTKLDTLSVSYSDWFISLINCR